jgi:hypothetical protein
MAFLNYFGSPLGESEISHKVINFFETYTGFRTSVTSLRSLIESETTAAAANGLIDLNAPAAMCAAQGHSVKTSNKYYIKTSKSQKGQNARTTAIAYDIATASPAEPAVNTFMRLRAKPPVAPFWWSMLPPDPTPAMEETDDDDEHDDDDDDLSGDDAPPPLLPPPPLKKQTKGVVMDENGVIISAHGYDDWGEEHPHRNIHSIPGLKISWSDAEKAVVVQHLSECRKAVQPFVKLLDIIKSKREYRVVFHVHHVICNRLSEGENAVLKKKRNRDA